jgi:hypothetical protein
MIIGAIQISDDLDQVNFWRTQLLIRKFLLESRIPLEEEMQNHFLNDNDFEATSIMKEWINYDDDEIDSINKTLAKLKFIFGDVPDFVTKEVEKFQKNYEK